jgi:hypothetical protein
VTPALPPRKRLVVLAALTLVALYALWAAASWLRTENVDVPKYRHAPGYATQGTSRAAVQQAYLRWGSSDVRDKTAAACEAHSIEGWAAILGTPVKAQAVARELSVSVDPAFRRAAYLGCMDELRN